MSKAHPHMCRTYFNYVTMYWNSEILLLESRLRYWSNSELQRQNVWFWEPKGYQMCTININFMIGTCQKLTLTCTEHMHMSTMLPVNETQMTIGIKIKVYWSNSETMCVDLRAQTPDPNPILTLTLTHTVCTSTVSPVLRIMTHDKVTDQVRSFIDNVCRFESKKAV